MEYACEVWDPVLARTGVSSGNAQRRIARFIAELKGRESVSEARQNLGFQIVESRRNDFRTALMLTILSM